MINVENKRKNLHKHRIFSGIVLYWNMFRKFFCTLQAMSLSYSPQEKHWFNFNTIYVARDKYQPSPVTGFGLDLQTSSLQITCKSDLFYFKAMRLRSRTCCDVRSKSIVSRRRKISPWPISEAFATVGYISFYNQLKMADIFYE